jgi:hypothetical protein
MKQKKKKSYQDYWITPAKLKVYCAMPPRTLRVLLLVIDR